MDDFFDGPGDQSASESAGSEPQDFQAQVEPSVEDVSDSGPPLVERQYEIPEELIGQHVNQALDARLSQAQAQQAAQARQQQFAESYRRQNDLLRQARETGDHALGWQAAQERFELYDQMFGNAYQALQFQAHQAQQFVAWQQEQQVAQQAEAETLRAMTTLAVREPEVYRSTFNDYPIEVVRWLVEEDKKAGRQSDYAAHAATAEAWLAETVAQHGLDEGARLIHQFVVSRRQAQAQQNPIFTSQPQQQRRAPVPPTPFNGGAGVSPSGALSLNQNGLDNFWS